MTSKSVFVRDTRPVKLFQVSVTYRVDGAHLYADILNLTDMLHVTAVEGERVIAGPCAFSICITVQFIAFFSASRLCSWIFIISACILLSPNHTTRKAATLIALSPLASL